MRLLYPQYLTSLVIIPGLVLLYLWSLRQRLRGLESFGIPGPVRPSFTPLILTIVGLTLLIISLARPQWGIEERPVEIRKVDIVLALDTSTGMKAQDERPDRFGRAKATIDLLLDRLGGTRVGLVAFGPSSVVVSPLTTDPDTVKAFAIPINTNLFPEGGPNLGEAIGTSLGLLEDKERARAIILLTNGEDETVLTHPILERVGNEGVKVYAIGFGSLEGAPIPLYSKDGRFFGYKEDSLGNKVYTRLEEGILKKVASATGGGYYRPSSWGIDTISRELLEMGGIEATAEKMIQYKEGFQWFIMAGLIFLIIGKLSEGLVIPVNSSKSKIHRIVQSLSTVNH